MATLQLDIITQEKAVLSEAVDQVSAPAVTGELTILPGHIPLFTRLADGILKIKQPGRYREIALVGGFMDVSPRNQVTIMADSAIMAETANEAKAEAARVKAVEAMQEQVSDFSYKQAEISLRKAVMELKVARRRRESQSRPVISE